VRASLALNEIARPCPLPYLPSIVHEPFQMLDGAVLRVAHARASVSTSM
jgi:hypothetical protein